MKSTLRCSRSMPAHPLFLEASTKNAEAGWADKLGKKVDEKFGYDRVDNKPKLIKPEEATPEQIENLKAWYYGHKAQELYAGAKKGIDKAISSIGKEVGQATDFSPDVDMSGPLMESLLSESEIKRWQTIAGIKKSVI